MTGSKEALGCVVDEVVDVDEVGEPVGFGLEVGFVRIVGKNGRPISSPPPLTASSSSMLNSRVGLVIASLR